MSKHIYITVGDKKENGEYVDRFGAVSNKINYRGVADNDADIPSFTKRLARKGSIVIATDAPIQPLTVLKQDGRDFVVMYPPCFNDQMETLFPKISPA